MDAIALICRNCGGPYDLTETENHKPCPACGTENCRPLAEGDAADMLRRATTQRLRRDFLNAESSYQYVLRASPDEHEALWGLVQCRYGVEYVKDPRTGKPMPVVHAVRRRPMLTDPDFREACELAPEAVREQYRQEAAYIDGAMAKILALAESGEPYDVFLCHKTSRTDGAEGYTEDYNRAVQLYVRLEKAGYHVFFAPFAGLTPGDNYEAGIYHALATAKVMLVICSKMEHITSPWVRTEWQRFLEMSYEPGADKHLIPLLYNDFPPRRLPDDFRQLQGIAMGDLDAGERLMAALAKHVGEKAAPVPPPRPKPEPQPEPQPVVTYSPEAHFTVSPTIGGCVITEYTGPGGEVNIPPKIGGVQVVEVGEKAFFINATVTRVTIPAGMKNIGENAFCGCSKLVSVSLPEGLETIGLGAFDTAESLTTVVIPGTVKTIGKGAFERCKALSSVTIQHGVQEIATAAFLDCSSLTSITIPGSVTTVGEGAFQGCTALSSVTIQHGVQEIATAAFLDCPSLTSITIPGSVTTIGEGAFARASSLTRVSLAPGVRHIGICTFQSCKLLSDITLPEGLETIGDVAFGDATSLTTLVIPTTVRSIGPWAFTRSGLRSITLPEGLESIGDSAFDTAESLTTVVIPGTVKTIGKWAFARCKALSSVTIQHGVEEIAYGAFMDCSSLTSITIPGSVTTVGEGSFARASSLTHVSLAPGVRHIGICTFQRCKLLSDITLPEGLETIGDAAFGDATSLTTLVIPTTVRSIGPWAFTRSGLRRIRLPRELSDISENAFADCPDVVLYVWQDSPAHRYALSNNLRFAFISGS